MNDEQLTGVWTTLDPDVTQRRRIAVRVFAWLDAHDTSLAAEWLTLVRIAPFGTLGLAVASAGGLLFVSPILWFARALAVVLM